MTKEPIKNSRGQTSVAEKLLEHRFLQAHEHNDRRENLKRIEIEQRDKHHKEAQPVRMAQIELLNEIKENLEEISKEIRKPKAEKPEKVERAQKIENNIEVNLGKLEVLIGKLVEKVSEPVKIKFTIQ